MEAVEIIIFLLSGGATLIIGLFSWLMRQQGKRIDKLDMEICRLRDVRHEDRDKMTKLDSSIQLLRYDIEDGRKEMNKAIDRLTFLFRETAKMIKYKREDTNE